MQTKPVSQLQKETSLTSKAAQAVFSGQINKGFPAAIRKLLEAPNKEALVG